MRSKTLNAVLLVIAVVVDAGILFFSSNPWVRLIFGLWLLALVIYMASFLELGGLFGGEEPEAAPRRRFSRLRNSTGALLAEVRRLNWLVVDLDRGFRDHDTVEADIAASERHLAELLKEIRQNAGKADDERSVDMGTPDRERRVAERRQETTAE